MATILVAVFSLQGCGSSSSNGNTTTTPTTTPTTVAEVHLIEPNKVADYIDNFKLQQQTVAFSLDGVQSAFSFIEVDQESKIMIIKYDKGLAFLGFDTDKEEPINSLRLLEGDTTDLENFTPTKILEGVNIQTSEQNENIIYSGSVLDDTTQGLFSIHISINESFSSAGDAKLVLDGNKAFLSGTLGASTYIKIQEMINSSSVDTLVLTNVSGSVDDAINMHTGRLIRNAQLTTFMPADGEANSGGVDLFAAGAQRIYQEGGKLGVHSWCCQNGKDAGQLAVNDPAHDAQLTYFREMLGTDIGPEFYFFTINAARAQEIHLMTQDEIAKYTLTTP